MTATIESNQFAELSNGIKLHYASAGEKGRPLILFLHGFPEYWYEWETQLRAFGQDYYAVAPDMRGFNLSDMPADVSSYKAKYIIEDLTLLVAHLGYEKFVMVAHDWGGAIAWNFAIASPRQLHKLIIINAPHPYLFMKALASDHAQQKASDYMNWLRGTGSETLLALNDFAMMDKILAGTGENAARWFTEEVRRKYHECWSRGLSGGLNFYRASPLHPPSPGDVGPRRLELNPADFRVKVPTRVIWGEQDQALLKTQLDGLDEFVDDLKIERIPEGSHWVIHEQPERINQLIRGFLSEPTPRASRHYC
jgi:pimeloyl-ACP methyl ester carboxylesterase